MSYYYNYKTMNRMTWIWINMFTLMYLKKLIVCSRAQQVVYTCIEHWIFVNIFVHFRGFFTESLCINLYWNHVIIGRIKVSVNQWVFLIFDCKHAVVANSGRNRRNCDAVFAKSRKCTMYPWVSIYS